MHVVDDDVVARINSNHATEAKLVGYLRFMRHEQVPNRDRLAVRQLHDQVLGSTMQNLGVLAEDRDSFLVRYRDDIAFGNVVFAFFKDDRVAGSSSGNRFARILAGKND